MAEEASAVVIDTGTASLRAGIAGDENPLFVGPSAVGWIESEANSTDDGIKRNGSLLWCSELEDRLNRPSTLFSEHLTGAGDDVNFDGKGEKVEVRRLLRRGTIESWDETEGLWLHAVKRKLKLSTEEHPILLSEPPMNPKINRELTTQSMFENLGVPAMYSAMTSVLALYGSGKTGGLVVECGEGVSFTVAVVEGYVPQHACEKSDIGGIDLTAYLMDLLAANLRGKNDPALTRWRAKLADWTRPLNSSLQEEQLIAEVRNIKENFCYVSANLEEEKASNSCSERSYELPDGNSVTLGVERMLAPEALFDPSLLGRDPLLCSGIQYHALSTIMKSDADIRRELFGNLVIAGGSTGFEGFAERLACELSALAPSSSYRVKFLPMTATSAQTVDRSKVVWIGGSILASLSTFQQQWITKDEYDESGPAITHRKCF